MQFRLRSLLIVLVLAPPLLAEGWDKYTRWRNGGCSDKLKQIGIGLHNYHGDSLRTYPPETIWSTRKSSK